MKLYLCQHGHAVAKESDSDRPLSDRGRRDVENLTRVLSAQSIVISRIIHSGKTRARQTAILLATAVDAVDSVESVMGINPNDNPEAYAVELSKQDNDLLLVSHLPFVSGLASFLVTGEAEEDLLAFVPGSIACLERNQTRTWKVAWLLRPELVRESYVD